MFERLLIPLNKVNLGSSTCPNNCLRACFSLADPFDVDFKPILKTSFDPPFSIVLDIYLKSGKSFGDFTFSACLKISSTIDLASCSVLVPFFVNTFIAFLYDSSVGLYFLKALKILLLCSKI